MNYYITDDPIVKEYINSLASLDDRKLATRAFEKMVVINTEN